MGEKPFRGTVSAYLFKLMVVLVLLVKDLQAI